MTRAALYLSYISWEKVLAFAIVILFGGIAFYKESLLLRECENGYFNRLRIRSKTTMSGRTMVATFGGLLVAQTFN